MAQDALDRWWWPSLMMFGPNDNASANSDSRCGGRSSGSGTMSCGSNSSTRRCRRPCLGLGSRTKLRDEVTGHWRFGPTTGRSSGRWSRGRPLLQGPPAGTPRGPCRGRLGARGGAGACRKAAGSRASRHARGGMRPTMFPGIHISASPLLVVMTGRRLGPPRLSLFEEDVDRRAYPFGYVADQRGRFS